MPDAIAALIEAGLRVWMITGDKQETAINIGISCGLIHDAQHLLVRRPSAHPGCFWLGWGFGGVGFWCGGLGLMACGPRVLQHHACPGVWFLRTVVSAAALACKLPPTWERMGSVSTAFSKPFAACCPHTLQHTTESLSQLCPRHALGCCTVRLSHCEAVHTANLRPIRLLLPIQRLAHVGRVRRPQICNAPTAETAAPRLQELAAQAMTPGDENRGFGRELVIDGKTLSALRRRCRLAACFADGTQMPYISHRI